MLCVRGVAAARLITWFGEQGGQCCVGLSGSCTDHSLFILCVFCCHQLSVRVSAHNTSSHETSTAARVFARVCTYANARHMHMYTYVCIHTHVQDMCTCASMYVHTHMQDMWTCTRTYVHTHTYKTCAHVQDVRTHTHTHSRHVHTCTYVRRCTHARVPTCGQIGDER